ncbi:MAG: ribose 5-phosphate isomerase B [Deltaproteobacteria bacterium]|nr:MAG: ribose 5-phosphate isomerase B [Deltaproteobacteria bacterium]
MSVNVSNKVIIAADHAGYELKNEIADYLRSKKVDVIDLGTHSSDSVDYPDYAADVSKKILAGEAPLGILVCGTGVGMSIAANKFDGIRAAVVSESFSAQMSREHNNSNILCFGSRVVDLPKAKTIVDAWLGATFQGGRHENRLQKIKKIEEIC